MSDIGVDGILTNLDCNGVNLDFAEGHNLVRCFTLTKLLAKSARNARKGMVFSCGSIHCVFLPYKNQALTTDEAESKYFI